MANLLKHEPQFNELFDLRQTFDQLFNRFLSNAGSTEQRSERILYAVPPIESWVDPSKKEYHLSIALPGVDPKEVQVNLNGNELTVEGEHEQSNEKKDADYLEREFSFQRFQRTITLPETIDTQKISADYQNGVLEITSPLKESALPKQITVNTGGKSKSATA
jgi:HSP20 family protein